MSYNPGLIDEFIDLIKSYPDFVLLFELDDKTLEGLKLKKDVQYPWKNKKEEKAYYKYMSFESKTAILENIKWLNVSSYERIHILISWSFVLRMSSVFMLLFSILNIVLHVYTGALMYFIVAVLLFVLNKWFLFKANKADASRVFTEYFFRMQMDKLKEEAVKKIESSEKKDS